LLEQPGHERSTSSFKTIRRHVLYVRPDYLLILDKLESNSTPREFAALLNTGGKGS
jgi:hypothetical protein